MKIVIINGSPRINGLTAGILHVIGKSLISLGAEVEFYNLSELTMSQCRGCCA
ncbi:MAG: flavodoxin family protein, partial [Clostridiales bacterium]|nr:flavodoxin family protein [Clostridiales bacterium]